MSEENKSIKEQEHWISHILPVLIIAGLVGILAIMADQPVRGYVPLIPQELWLTKVVGFLIIAIELFTAFIITSALTSATISYTRHLFDSINRQINYTERIRLRLGHMLNLGLEFAIGSDILRLSVTPSTQDIIILFTKVLLRILLNYFLDREIRASEELCGPGDYVPPLLSEEELD
ncbi:MAG: DUF1622 domain-containing protein [Brevefilum sp.]